MQFISYKQTKKMTNNAQLTYQIYKWLTNLDVLPNNQKYKSSGNFSIDSRVQQELLSGYLIGKLLMTLAEEKRFSVNGPLISSIKNSNTPAARVYNWNILNDGFQKFGINLTKQKQKQITSGNFEALVHFLIDVYSKTAVKVQKSNISTNNYEKSFDVKKMVAFDDIKNSQTLLEFIVVSISNYLSLTPKQAVSTLSQSAKFLAHMIVKGIKGSFDEIIELLEFFKKEMDFILFLSEQDPQKNYELFLQILKPTLISRQPDVATEGASAFYMFIQESLKYNEKNIIYQILCKEEETFDFMYMGIKRHPYLNFQIWSFVFLLVKDSMNEFLEVQLKKTINNEQEYLRTFLILLEPMVEDQQTKKILIQMKILNIWEKKLDSLIAAKVKSKDQSAINEETKLLYIQILSELWKSFYNDIEKEDGEQLVLKLVEELKKNTRLDMFSIKIPSLYRIFSFLQFLAENKNKLAAIVYKKIIFLFVENHESSELRQIILENFVFILKKFPTIPLQFLLEPLLKQITTKEGTSYILNLFDFDFMLEVFKHPKMEEYFAVDFFVFFSKLYVKSIIFSPIIFRLIEVITSRFCESQSLREHIIVYSESILNIYGMMALGKSKSKGYQAQQRNRKKEQTILNNQKKSMIIQILKHFIKLEHRDLTKEIRWKVTELYMIWYQERNHNDKGLHSILLMFGDIDEVCLQYRIQKEEQLKEQQEIYESKRRTEERETLSRQQQSYGSNSPGYNHSKIDDPFSDDLIEDYGLGYRKKKHTRLINKKELKPDPRVLEDIERIKQKWKLENSRAKLQMIELKKDRDRNKLNEKELLQRNISLGYNKLPNFSQDKILFDYDSVKTKHLKVGQEFIDLQQEEERESKSVENILQRYNKYIKLLFRKYAYASGAKSGAIGNNIRLNDELILSFTQIMRMLKDKNVLQKVPKIAINQILTSINYKKRKQRNVLGGIYEKDFSTFLVYFTDIYLQYERTHLKDEPFGIKLQNMILLMVQDEKGARELFDPKVLKLKEAVEKDEDIQIPEGYRKIDEVQINLVYNLDDQTGIGESYASCAQIVNELLFSALKINSFPPITDFIEKKKIIIVPKVPTIKFTNATEKNMKRPVTGDEEEEKKENENIVEEKKPRKRSSMHKYLDTRKKSRSQKMVKSQNKTEFSMKQKQEEEKEKKRQKHAEKLKEEIIRLRDEKQKKKEEQNAKKKQLQKKKLQREEIRQKYLEDNKKKIEENKKKQEDEKSKLEKKEKEEKEKKKNEIKAKESELLEKEKKQIHEKFEKMQKKKKEEEEKKKQKEKINNNKSPVQLFKKNKQHAQDERIKEMEIKNSLKKGELKDVIQEHNKQLQNLFESYWDWKKQKIQLRGIANILKDFNISPDYIHPKQIPEVYKGVCKGQLADFNGFIQVLTKLAFKSEKIKQQQEGEKREEKREENEKKEGKEGNNGNEDGKLNKNILIYLFGLLKMKDEMSYQQVLKTYKSNQLG